jgi:hypothetical protein
MGVIMSMVKTLKEFVMKKEKVKEKEKEEIHTLFGPIGPRLNITEVAYTPAINKLRLILREDDEINRIHKHHDEWAERIKRTCVGDDLQTRLAEVEDFRQRRLQAAPAVVKRRALKIQREAEREADPVKMAKYLAQCKKQCDYRWNWLCKQTDSEREEMYRKKRNALRITTPP